MKCLFSVVLFLSLISSISAQKGDYLKIREQVYVSTCGSITKQDIESSIMNLHAVDTNNMKNLHMYYEDLGMYHWLLSNSNPAQIDTVIKYNFSALHHKPNATKAFWNLAFAYKQKDDCQKVIEYINRYKEFTKQKYG